MPDPNPHAPTQREIQRAEHDDTGNVQTKKVILYGWDTDTLAKLKLNVDKSGRLAITPFQDFDITSISRNAGEYITQIVMTDGTQTKTIDITRDGNNYITAIANTIS